MNSEQVAWCKKKEQEALARKDWDAAYNYSKLGELWSRKVG